MNVSYSESSSVIALMWCDHSYKHDVKETSSYIRVNAMCGSVGYWKVIFQYEQKKQDFSISFFSAVTQRIFKIFFLKSIRMFTVFEPA